MAEKSLVKSGRKEINEFVKGKSLLELFDTLTLLEKEEPYVELSPNGEIGEFLQTKGISVVHSKADFDYLYESLRTKMEELRDKDERVKTYLQNANHQRQMTELPVLISKLERGLSRFDILKEPVKSTLTSFYKLVEENEIEINTGKMNLFKKKNEPDLITISKGTKDDSIELVAEYNKPWKNIKSRHLNEFFNLEICPVYKTEPHEKIEEIKTIFGKRLKKTPFEIKQLEDVTISWSEYYEGDENDWGWIIEDYPSGEFLDYLLKQVKANSINKEDFKITIKILLNLPIIISNQLKKSEKELDNLFSEIQ